MVSVQHVISIESLAVGGDGVARLNSKVCFVPGGVPGDVLKIRLTAHHKRLLRGEIIEIIEPGPGRREPICPFFQTCGGCQWLHIREEVQLKAKNAILCRALDQPQIEITPSPHILDYRRLARLHFDPASRALGFTEHRTKKLVDITKCPILEGSLSDALIPLKELLAPLKHVIEVRLAASDPGPVVVIESSEPLPPDYYEQLRRSVPHPFAGIHVSLEGITSCVAGETEVRSQAGDGDQFVEPAQSFGQANREINLLLVGQVEEWISHRARSSVLELFAGSGNLSIVLARWVKALTLVERDADAVRAARGNLERRGLTSVNVIQGDALAIYDSLGSNYETVVLDPPRTGHRDLARAIARGKQRTVIYVSCDPATLGRDLTELKKGGFHLQQACGFDMFPQTAHLEAMVLLER